SGLRHRDQTRSQEKCLHSHFHKKTQMVHNPDSFSEMGAGRIGRRSCERSRFSISICSTRILGETAETGTHPDSAPQVPLKTAGSSPVARIFEKQERGVP